MIIVEVDQIPKIDDITDAPLDDKIKLYNVCLEMQQVCEREHGIGISAVQVGVPWKLFLVKGDGTCPLVPKGRYRYFANTEYEPTSNERVVSVEGCLSIRSQDGQLRSFQVERYQKIKIKGFLLDIYKMIFEEFDVDILSNQQGVVFEHEVDHQRGILISDIGKEVFFW